MQLDRIVTSRTMATLRTRFPCVFAQRDEPAQPLNARVAHRPRLEVGQDSFKRHPRGRPIVSAVIQHPLRVENHSVYDLGNPDHGASHVFSPAQSPALAAAKAAPLTSSGFASIRVGRRCVRGRDDTVGRANLRKHDRDDGAQSAVANPQWRSAPSDDEELGCPFARSAVGRETGDRFERIQRRFAAGDMPSDPHARYFAKSAAVRTQELQWFVRVCLQIGCRKGTAHGSPWDIVTSGIVNRRRQSRHDKINAIELCRSRRVYSVRSSTLSISRLMAKDE